MTFRALARAISHPVVRISVLAIFLLSVTVPLRAEPDTERSRKPKEVPPVMLWTVPGNGSGNAYRQAALEVHYDTAISLKSARFTLTGKKRKGAKKKPPKVKVYPMIDGSGTAILLFPNLMLDAETQYTLKVRSVRSADPANKKHAKSSDIKFTTGDQLAPPLAPSPTPTPPGATPTPTPMPTPPPHPVGLLLNDTNLGAVKQKVAANTAQWQAFKHRLDQNLLVNVDAGAYQGSELEWIADYGLGYVTLKATDPATAAKYADKALAVLKSALHDYQVGGIETRQFLVRGDGATTTFTIPNADYIPSTVHVYISDVTTLAVTKGAANTPDSVNFYSTFIKVSDTSDGAPTYREGVDWKRNPELRNDALDWSLPGAEPAPGAKYYVSLSSGLGATNWPFTLQGSTITITNNGQPFGPGKAIYLDYLYGTPSSDGSTLAYQQTSAGDGGFTSIYKDDTYTSRYLGKYVSIGYDWLNDYVGFSAPLKNEAEAVLVKWFDFEVQSGYYYGYPTSNYGAGAYVSNVFTAIALSNAGDPNAARLLSSMTAFHRQSTVPALQNASASLKGGFWAEGWSYGDLAAQNVLLSALAYENSNVASADAERAWSAEVTAGLLSAEPSQWTVYDGGDWFAYPAPLPGNDLFTLLETTTTDSKTRQYDEYVMQHRGQDTHDFVDMLYRDPSVTPAYWTSDLPLHALASGTGLVTARADWSYASTWLSFQLGNLLSADHQTYSPGQIELQRGGDALLVNASVLGDYQPAAGKSQFGNLVLIDDNGEGAQNYRFSMGYWYGTPGVFLARNDTASDHVYAAGDYHAAYSLNTSPGAGGPASELTRQVAYLRPDSVVVHDRVTTTKSTYLKQLQWHFISAPAVSGNSWVVTQGESKLFGQTLSTQALTTSAQPVTVGDATVEQVTTKPAAAVASVRFITALETAPSSTASMVSTELVVSTDNRMEGAHIGNNLVLFGTDHSVDPATGITYTFHSGGTTSHLLVDLIPGRTYSVTVGSTAISARASEQGVLSFSSVGTGVTMVHVQ